MGWLKGSALKALPGEASPQEPTAPAQDVPEVLVAEGGPESCTGEYHLTPTVHHGRPVWKGTADPRNYLFFSLAANAWHIAGDLDEQPIDHAAVDGALPFGLSW